MRKTTEIVTRKNSMCNDEASFKQNYGLNYSMVYEYGNKHNTRTIAKKAI